MSVYYALVESILTYGIIGWGNLYKKYRNRLENIHKKALKIIYNKAKHDKSDKNLINNILTIEGLYYFVAIKHNIDFLLEKYSKLHDKRTKQIILPKKKNKVGQRTNLYTSIKIFNMCKKLDKDNIKKNKSLLWKKATKKMLLKKYNALRTYNITKK